jgi:hypothetical protein
VTTTCPTFKQLADALGEDFDEWAGPYDYTTDEEREVVVGPVTIRWEIVTDEHESSIDQINDWDESIYGRLAWGERTDYREYDRPRDFDGNAEKMDRYNLGFCQGDYIGLWWQPPKAEEGGAPARGTPEFEQMRRDLCELITWGFVGIRVTVLIVTPEGVCPHCGAGAEVRHGRGDLWGIEAAGHGKEGDTFDYRREVLIDNLGEAIVEADPIGHYIQVDHQEDNP